MRTAIHTDSSTGWLRWSDYAEVMTMRFVYEDAALIAKHKDGFKFLP